MAYSPALQLQKFKVGDRLLPPRGGNIYPAGINDSDKGFVRYAAKSTDQPNLIIATPIYDDDGGVIMPGYYELILSGDRQTLILAQSQVIIATIPVFKIEEDKSQIEPPPTDDKSQRKADKEQKKKEKKNKKLIKEGKLPAGYTPEIFTNASIQYEEDGGYYLINYERGKIKAWGALKL